MLNKNNQAEVLIKKIEQLRTDLIEQGDDLINETIEQYPTLERQKMRQLVRNAAKEVKAEKPGKVQIRLLDFQPSSLAIESKFHREVPLGRVALHVSSTLVLGTANLFC